jgi:hypothetical protein
MIMVLLIVGSALALAVLVSIALDSPVSSWDATAAPDRVAFAFPTPSSGDQKFRSA